MPKTNRSPGLLAWAITNLTLLILACLVWGWLDYRYVTQFWTPEEMRETTDWLMLGIIAGAMLANLWLLRKRSLPVHLLGALASALAVTGAWWVILALAGSAFHAAIGGTPAS